MGYEIKVLIGKSTSWPRQEMKRTNVRYKDDSGWEPELDDKGNYVYTDRTEHYFDVYAVMDMCKLGCQSDALNTLIGKSFALAKNNENQIHHFYASDGNTMIQEDRYGSRMHPVSLIELKEALDALPDMDYRRLRWLKALVDEMVKDKEPLQVMFIK